MNEANYDNRHNEEYRMTYDETTILLNDLFSEAEAKKFQGVELPRIFISPVNHEKDLQEYKKEIIRYIFKLEDYKEKIQYFWFNGDTGEDKKLVEKTLLLMRFYGEERIYEIGKEMGIPFFDQFHKYSEMSYHRGALEISREIKDDEELVKLIKENPPKYGLSLGGFQGSYYTATEGGELSLSSSSEKVRKNVKKSLDNWDKKAYGVLRAIVNKCGTVTKNDITDEIEKILEPGYSWANLLPRLVPRRLVFKIFYNGNPCWKMPEEIIPIVQEQLSIYERSVDETQKIHERENVQGPFEYDIAISFAGEDREIAKNLAEKIRNKRVKVFYDKFYKHDLWGKELTEYFRDVYGARTRFVVILISEHYPVKDWTDFEFSIARAEAKKRQTEFILPIRIDNTKILGIHGDVGYLDYRKEGLDEIVNCLMKKLSTVSPVFTGVSATNLVLEYQWQGLGILTMDLKSAAELKTDKEILVMHQIGEVASRYDLHRLGLDYLNDKIIYVGENIIQILYCATEIKALGENEGIFIGFGIAYKHINTDKIEETIIQVLATSHDLCNYVGEGIRNDREIFLDEKSVELMKKEVPSIWNYCAKITGASLHGIQVYRLLCLRFLKSRYSWKLENGVHHVLLQGKWVAVGNKAQI